MNPMAKGLALVFGVPVLFGIAFFYNALATGEQRMTEVCAQIEPGMSLAQLRDFAADHGLSQPGMDAGVAYLGEGKTYGRFACKVELEAGVVKSSAYSHAD